MEMRSVSHRTVVVLLGCAACLTTTFGVGYRLAASDTHARREAPRYTAAQGPARTAALTRI